MSIRLPNPRVEKALEILSNIPQIPLDKISNGESTEEDVGELIRSFSNSELTALKRRLENTNPGLARLVRECHQESPGNNKFLIRFIAFRLCSEIAKQISEASDAVKPKLRRIG
ncbi:MAG: hypothetical protein U9M89_02290 [Patescibacteria group bacterium]|nr:hypothetical protein [Patescibacteria group bacterium]